MARASTIAPAPPIAWMNRAAIRMSIDCAIVQTNDAAVNNTSAASSTGRRP